MVLLNGPNMGWYYGQLLCLFYNKFHELNAINHNNVMCGSQDTNLIGYSLHFVLECDYQGVFPVNLQGV